MLSAIARDWALFGIEDIRVSYHRQGYGVGRKYRVRLEYVPFLATRYGDSSRFLDRSKNPFDSVIGINKTRPSHIPKSDFSRAKWLRNKPSQ
jgi:hypothetical protein